jgi:hypothetical protein
VEKLKRQVYYSSGVNFTKGETQDEARKTGALEFRSKGQKMNIIEMNLDEK